LLLKKSDIPKNYNDRRGTREKNKNKRNYRGILKIMISLISLKRFQQDKFIVIKKSHQL